MTSCAGTRQVDHFGAPQSRTTISLPRRSRSWLPCFHSLAVGCAMRFKISNRKSVFERAPEVVRQRAFRALEVCVVVILLTIVIGELLIYSPPGQKAVVSLGVTIQSTTYGQ